MHYKNKLAGIAFISIVFLVSVRGDVISNWFKKAKADTDAWSNKATADEATWVSKATSESVKAVDNVVVKPIVQTAKTVGEWVDNIGGKEYFDHPYAKVPAQVRVGNELPPAEQQYVANRLKVVKKSLENTFPEISFTDQSIPRVAFCFTGGGYRAMTATLGFLEGAQDTDMLNKVTYLAGLSGSSWAIVPWLMSGIKNVKDYIEQLIPQVGQPVNFGLIPVDERAEVDKRLVAKRDHFKQTLSVIDNWGALLASRLLGWSRDTKQGVYYSKAVDQLQDGSWPLTIGTAVSNGSRTANMAPGAPYVWFEFTPYEVGSEYLHAWVPTWAFGRKFDHGSSLDFAPEQTLGYLLGIFGSAFSIDFNIVGAKSLQDMIVKTQGEEKYNEFARHRVVDGGIVNNFAQALDSAPDGARALSELNLVDAGYDGNVPYLPLVRPERDVDIIVFFDISDASFPGQMLVNMWNNIAHAPRPITTSPLKDVDHEGLSSMNVTTIGDTADLSKHVIIYIPQIKNDRLPTYGNWDPRESMKFGGFSHMANFVYTPEQFKTLSGYARETFEFAAPTILDKIKERALAKGAQYKK